MNKITMRKGAQGILELTSLWLEYFYRQPLGGGRGNFLGDFLDENNEPNGPTMVL